MNDLQIFENPEFGQVRTVEIDGTPWLVGKDVAVALGYKNPGKAIIAHVDEEDKRLEMLPQGADSQNGNVSPSSKTALIQDRPHQRVRPVQPDFVQQDAQGQGFQALGDQRGAARHPQNRCLRELSGTAAH